VGASSGEFGTPASRAKLFAVESDRSDRRARHLAGAGQDLAGYRIQERIVFHRVKQERELFDRHGSHERQPAALP
jgi:hypothetical protein